MTFPKIIETIKFEINNLGIIRLEDHLDTISKIANKFALDPKAVCQDFLKKLESTNLDYNKVQLAQSISLNPQVIQFYNEHKLINKKPH